MQVFDFPADCIAPRHRGCNETLACPFPTLKTDLPASGSRLRNFRLPIQFPQSTARLVLRSGAEFSGIRIIPSAQMKFYVRHSNGAVNLSVPQATTTVCDGHLNARPSFHQTAIHWHPASPQKSVRCGATHVLHGSSSKRTPATESAFFSATEDERPTRRTAATCNFSQHVHPRCQSHQHIMGCCP